MPYKNVIPSLHAIFLSFFAAAASYGQQINTVLEFGQYESEYVPLEHADTLTSDNPEWGANLWTVNLDSFPAFSGTEQYPMQWLGINTNGQIALWHFLNSVDYELDIYMTPFFTTVISPLRDPINEDIGHILHYSENQIHFIEFRNVALTIENVLAGGRLTARINYLVEIDPVSDKVRFIYGPSTFHGNTASHIFANGVQAGVLLELWKKPGPGQEWKVENNFYLLLENAPESPEINTGSDPHNPLPDRGLNAFPPEGTVYEFNFSKPTSVQSETSDPATFEVYPNPGKNQLKIVASNHAICAESTAIIYRSCGSTVLQKFVGDALEVDTKSWESGMYIIKVGCKNYSHIYKWIRK